MRLSHLLFSAFVLCSAARPAEQHPVNVAIDLANRHTIEGNYGEAETVLRNALRVAEEAGAGSEQAATVLLALGNVCTGLGRYFEAERVLRRSLSIWEKRPEANVIGINQTLVNLGTLYLDTGRFAKAEKISLRLLGNATTPAARVSARNQLASAYRLQGRNIKAEPLLREALDIWDQQIRPGKPALAVFTLNNLGVLLSCERRYEEARAVLERAKALAESGDVSFVTLLYIDANLGRAYAGMRRDEESNALFAKSLAGAENKLGSQHPLVGWFLAEHAAALRESGRKRQAAELERRARVILSGNARENLLDGIVDPTALTGQ